MATHRHQHPNPNAPRRRILRIGVLLGGKIVEERLIRDRAPVSIGQSSKNTFSVPLETLPREHTLFGLDGNGQYRMQFGPKMDGRVSDGSSVYTFDQVKGNKAVQHGDHWVMPLSDQARGKVTIGDLTLLFQFVTEPPVQPKPMLPASVRGTLADRIDPRLAVICAISIVVHFGFALAAWLHDLPDDHGMLSTLPPDIKPEENPDPVTVDLIEPAPVEPTTDEQQPAAETEKPAESKGAKGPTKKPSGGGSPGGGRSEQSAAALEEEAARYAALLASDGGSGGIEGRMSKTAPGGDLNQQIDETRKGGGEVKLGGGGGTRGSGDPRQGTGGTRGPGGGGGTSDVGGGKGKEETPPGRIQVASKKAYDDTNLSPEAVMQKILSAYLAGLKRCYKALLKNDPTARGRVELSFTVNEKGRVTSPKAKSDYREMSSCIEGQMTSWTFPAPKDSDGEATDAAFGLTLALQPD